MTGEGAGAKRGVSIHAKLVLAFGTLVLITAVVGAVGIWSQAASHRAFLAIASESLPAVSHLIQTDRDLQRALAAERTLMFMRSDSPAAQEQAKLHEASLALVREHWTAYAAAPSAGQEAVLGLQFEKARASWEASSREALKLLAQDSVDARKDAIDISLNEGAQKFDATRKILAGLGEFRLQRTDAEVSMQSRNLAGIRWLVIGCVAASLVLAGGLCTIIARSVVRPLAQTAALLRDIAEGEGDLTRRLNADRRDEVGEVARWFNAFMDTLHDIMVRVRAAAGQATTAASELSAAVEQLSTGAQEQASSLEETVASLEEITGTVRQNADNARQASQLAVGSRGVAEKGGQVVTDAMRSMAGINQASKRVVAIIKTIDEIAFQTNLLALNAAVEAARAGAQGRGFAVVAAEVRNLAQRSAAAAREIKGLIQDSVERVDGGTELVNKSGETLGEIVGSVKRVTDIIAEIATASQEQSAGIDQVKAAVTQVDQVTQANAAQMEELSSTAGTLAAQATELHALVGRFKLAGSERPARPSAEAREEPAPRPRPGAQGRRVSDRPRAGQTTGVAELAALGRGD